MAVPRHGGLTFPRPRRRPLKSKTYNTFLRVLALSSHPSFNSPLQDDGSWKAQELCSTESRNALVDSESVRDDMKEGEDILNMQSSLDLIAFEENKDENQGFDDILDLVVDSESVRDDMNEGDSFLNMQSSLDLIACNKNKEEKQGFDDIFDLVVDVGNGSDPVSESMHKHNDAHCMLEVQSSSFSPGRELKGNGEFSLNEVCEAIDCSLNVDAAAELLRRAESGAQEAAVEEQNMSMITEQELQHKEMELEKLIMSSSIVDASPFASAYEDIEEGELPRDMGADDISDREEFACDFGQSEIEKNKAHTSLIEAITKESNIMEVDGRCGGENQLLEIRGPKEQSGEMTLPCHSPVAADCPAPAGGINSERAVENRSSAAAEKWQDDGDRKNKRKRGPVTKERKEKKKKKERIKRAEKNRALGVKHLKIQPMVKPKAVSYCRHYIKGRCQEGEKCKFSHDTVPITKSTPCCHFARHSCMKGDDCPFDHQLSKYPCNNYATKGFCSRGVDCLFSHEIPAKEARPVISYVDACEMKTSSASSSQNPKDSEKQYHIHSTTSQKAEARSCPTGSSNVRNNGQHSAVPVKIHSIQPPKGINILSHGHMSAVPGKQLDSQLSKADFGDERVQSLPHNHQKVNDVVDMAAAKTPRGINFLSFGKSPMSGSNGKVASILNPNSDSRNGKSALVTPTPNGNGATKADGQDMQITSPPLVPRGINFISIGKSTNSCIPGERLNHQPSDSKSAPTSVREGECALPHKSSSSSFTYISTVDSKAGIASSSKSPFLSESSPTARKALHSTLSFATNVEQLVRLNSSKTASFGASTVLDYLNGSNFKPKT